MNIFFLSECPMEAAVFQCDKHIVKMPTETAQLLCTTAHELGVDPSLIPYKKTHVNHPCAIWVRSSWGAYQWTLAHGLSLAAEYQRRYQHTGNTHSAWAVLRQIRSLLTPDMFPAVRVVEDPPQCMPDYCKVDGDPVQAYRNYYIKEKAYMAEWKYSNVPDWWEH